MPKGVSSGSKDDAAEDAVPLVETEDAALASSTEPQSEPSIETFSAEQQEKFAPGVMLHEELVETDPDGREL